MMTIVMTALYSKLCYSSFFITVGMCEVHDAFRHSGVPEEVKAVKARVG